MGTFPNFVGLPKQAVRHHGGVTRVLRRIWQVLALEGFLGLKRKITRLLVNRKAFAVSHDVDGGTQVQPASSSEKSHGSMRPALSPGVLLLGHPYGVLGIGENIRLSAAACSAAEVPFGIRSVYGEHGVHVAAVHKDFLFMDKISRDGIYRTNVFHLNADEMGNAQKLLGKDLFADRYNIGYWSWELSHFPDAWRPSLQLVDEVWAPSRFIEQAIADKTSSPVIRMPLAVEFPEPTGMCRQRGCAGKPLDYLRIASSSYFFSILPPTCIGKTRMQSSGLFYRRFPILRILESD